jgi:hypothetical protein
MAEKPFDGYASALARLAARKAEVPVRTDEPMAGEYRAFRPARPLSAFHVDGQVPKGWEVSGLLFPFRVMDAPGEYAVIGETVYPDGRRFLDFGIRPEWIEDHSDYRFLSGRPDNPVWVCPECGGIGDAHGKVTTGGLPSKCPRETRRRP